MSDQLYYGGQASPNSVLKLEALLAEARLTSGEAKKVMMTFAICRGRKMMFSSKMVFLIVQYLPKTPKRVHRVPEFMNFNIDDGECTVAVASKILNRAWPGWMSSGLPPLEEAVTMMAKIYHLQDVADRRMKMNISAVLEYKKSRHV